MLAPWAVDEMKAVDLGDKRLNDRLKQVLSNLGARPTASIPSACGGFNEMAAAYRLFANERTTAEKILEPHAQRTRERMAAQTDVLLVQDTTEINLTRPHQQVAGAGPLDGAERRGVLLHLLQAFTPDGTPLGALWSKIWTRDDPPPEETAEDRRRTRKQAPIEDKESVRWVDGVRRAAEAADALPHVRCVCIADSEADIFELFTEPRGEGRLDWIVRACQDRACVAAESDEMAENLDMRQRVARTPALFSQEISVRGREPKIACDQRGRRQPRSSRTATVEVRATTVTLRGPYRPGGSLADVAVHVVHVREVNPPPDDEPVDWLLITTLPIGTLEEIRRIIQYYAARFMIEVFFRTLKSGCRAEQRRFEILDHFLPCLATYLIVAWRTLMVCRLGREYPDMDCEMIFDPAEWKAVWMVAQRKPLPAAPPKLPAMVKLIAQLGGYVKHKNHNDLPGVQTVWLGMQRMYDLALAWQTFGPGNAAPAQKEEGTCV